MLLRGPFLQGGMCVCGGGGGGGGAHPQRKGGRKGGGGAGGRKMGVGGDLVVGQEGVAAAGNEGAGAQEHPPHVDGLAVCAG